MNKTTLIISSIVLTLSSVFSMTAFAESHEKAEVECVTEAAFAEMSDDEKATLEAPMCIGDEGEDQSQEEDEPTKAE